MVRVRSGLPGNSMRSRIIQLGDSEPPFLGVLFLICCALAGGYIGIRNAYDPSVVVSNTSSAGSPNGSAASNIQTAAVNNQSPSTTKSNQSVTVRIDDRLSLLVHEKTIVDSTTNLQWMTFDFYKLENSLLPEEKVESAIEYLNNLKIGGHDDWVLPICQQIKAFQEYLDTHSYSIDTQKGIPDAAAAALKRPSGSFVPFYWCALPGNEGNGLYSLRFSMGILSDWWEWVKPNAPDDQAGTLRLVRQAVRLH